MDCSRGIKYEKFTVKVSTQRIGQSEMPDATVDNTIAKKVFEDSASELKLTASYKYFTRDKLDLDAIGVQIRLKLQVILKQPWKS